MIDRKSEIFKILFYLVLFCLAFLVFESLSIIVAVSVALFALYYLILIFIFLRNDPE